MSVNFNVKFSEQNFEFDVKCSESLVMSDGGFDIGYSNGYEEGYESGKSDGHTAGYSEGYTAGETSGYNKGLEEGADALDTLDGIIDGNFSEHCRSDRVTSVRMYGFYGTQFTSIDLPNVTTIGNNAFTSAKMKTINLPLVEQIPFSAFNSCSELQSASFPFATSIGSQGFVNCKKLTDVYISSVTSIASSAFQNNYSLIKLILQSTNICKLGSATAFNGCYHILGTVNATYNPEGLKDGYIYVPDDLVEDYKVATNWATYASQIKPLSELEE